jgi:hypothetical protein
MNAPHVVLDDVLDDLMMNEPQPTYEALLRWSTQYPQFRDALMSIFAEWGIQTELTSETQVNEGRLLNLGVSHALNVFHGRVVAKSQKIGLNKAPRLLASAEAAGFSIDNLVQATKLDAELLRKLDLRRLTNVPRACLQRLAEELHVVMDQITLMVMGTPLVGAEVRHKSRQKPIAVTETFSDAIRKSSLSAEDKLSWLAMVKAEQEQEQ